MAQLVPEDPNLNALAAALAATSDPEPGKRKQGTIIYMSYILLMRKLTEF